ncbi:hypothetical protein FOQG_17709 [Fusarium oxysporum f. sp. raphani 54005]|uniref:Uncharacterized protein n=1 Tax=Fusarium oxysporum f. sp. raphani 54005 TaxID=1089458 RepID=X0BFG6_FUSOX|nr:hypothetical protein FOQG_17709 [Fusarium oxysporum f. sp. raphani 54005]
MDDLREAAESALKSLYVLPTNCPAKDFDDVIVYLTKSLALAKVLRAWSLGIKEGLSKNYRTKRMNNYFKLLCTLEEEANNTGKTSQRNTHKFSHNSSKEIPVLSHLINSVSYIREDARRIDPDMVDVMKDENMYTKFVPILSSHEDFREHAWSITTKKEFKTLHCREDSDQGQLASKRRRDEQDIPQKRAKQGIGSHPEAPTTEDTQACLQEHQTSQAGPLAVSSSVTQERELGSRRWQLSVIQSRAAILHLQQTLSLWLKTAVFARPYSRDRYFPSCLVFQTHQDVEFFRRLPKLDVDWKTIPKEAHRALKDSEESLKVVMGEINSVDEYAGLAFLPATASGEKPRIRLVFYQGIAITGVLAQLPDIPCP